MIKVKEYSKKYFQEWNMFNKNSKNSIFMFDRNYMDYHSDRFFDFSLMFYDEDDELIALLPMNRVDNVAYSHAGLTYGGFITNNKMKQYTMLDCFDALIKHVKEKGVNEIIYKTIPHIYHKQPSEEDIYALYVNKAELITVDASTCANLNNSIKKSKGRKAQISRAIREKVEIKELTELNEFNTFIEIENDILKQKYGTKAVHTGAELKLLHDSFPNGVRLFGAFKDNDFIAGIVVFEYDDVIHTQYMAANSFAKKIGALDYLVSFLMEKYKNEKSWIDFGISTEHNRIYLNEGLARQKESFGGRTNVYETWKMRI